jgi:hypothetical protein
MQPRIQRTKENHPPPFSPLFDEVKFAKTKKQLLNFEDTARSKILQVTSVSFPD